MLPCSYMKPVLVLSHHNLHAAKLCLCYVCRYCQHRLLLVVCYVYKQFGQFVLPNFVHFCCEAPVVPCLLLQVLVDKALIKTVSLEWAGAEGSAWSSPAPAAATGRIATRNFVMLTQRMKSQLAASWSTYFISYTIQTGAAMAEVYVTTPALFFEMCMVASHNLCYRSPAHGYAVHLHDMRCR